MFFSFFIHSLKGSWNLRTTVSTWPRSNSWISAKVRETLMKEFSRYDSLHKVTFFHSNDMLRLPIQKKKQINCPIFVSASQLLTLAISGNFYYRPHIFAVFLPANTIGDCFLDWWSFFLYFLQLRDDVINQTSGSATLFTKYHYDNMVSVDIQFHFDFKLMSFGSRRIFFFLLIFF